MKSTEIIKSEDDLIFPYFVFLEQNEDLLAQEEKISVLFSIKKNCNIVKRLLIFIIRVYLHWQYVSSFEGKCNLFEKK